MTTSTSGATGSAPGGMAGVQSDPRQATEGMEAVGDMKQKGEGTKADPKEEAVVAKYWKAYDDARKFDENFRKQVAIDLRYAAGTSDL